MSVCVCVCTRARVLVHMRVCGCVCICRYVRGCVCVCVCVCMYECVCMCCGSAKIVRALADECLRIRVRMQTCAGVRARTCRSLYLHVCSYVSLPLSLHMRACVRAWVRAYVRVCVCVYVCVCVRACVFISCERMRVWTYRQKQQKQNNKNIYAGTYTLTHARTRAKAINSSHQLNSKPHNSLMFQNNTRLKELKVRHNKFGELGGLYLGPAIGECRFVCLSSSSSR